MDAGPPDVVTWLRAVAREELRDDAVDGFVRQVDDGILAQLPQLAADPVLTQDLDHSTRSQWRAFLTMVADDEYRHELPLPATGLATSLARRGMDLGVLLKIYRTAHHEVLQYVSELTHRRITDASGPAPARDEVLVFVWSRAGQWIDDTIEQLIETFYDERRRLRRGALARRGALIEALLDTPATAGEGVSGELGHALHQWQTGFVIWHAADRAPDPDPDPGLAAAVAELARAVGAPPALLHVAGSRDRWGWLATPTRPDLSGPGGLAAGSALADLLAESGVRLAVGLPATGVAGFRSSHQEARAAHRVATAAPLAPQIVDYRDVELLCLVEGNQTLVERMVAREIGPLCGADKNLALVRRTALEFLAHRSIDAAADRLFVHKNTVRYRLGKAEELLGHPLTERSAQVELALRHVALFGVPTPE